MNRVPAVVLLCLLPTTALAQSKREVALAAAVAETERFLEGFVHETGIPGAAFGVSLDGEVLFSAAVGWADRERRIPATPETLFRIASISKPLTAAGMARLVEEGELDLDAPVQDYVPEFPKKGEPITARQLAGHLAGIRHNRQQEVWNEDQPHYATLAEALTMFQDDPLVVRPGVAMSYSTPGYTLLGAVMEAAAGVEYRKLMRESVFEPLGMEDTLVDDPREDVPRRTSFYVFDGQAIVPSPYMDHSYKLPAGGYLSTVGDLLSFATAHLEPGFLREETLRTLTTSQKTSSGQETGYGMGWFAQPDYAGRPTIGHGGNQPGARAQVVAWPDEGLAAVFLCNVRGAPMGDDEVWTMTMPFFDAIEDPGSMIAPPEIDVVGEYELEWHEDGGRQPVRVVIDESLPFLRGTVLAPDLRTYRIVSARVSGRSVRLAAVHPGGMLALRFTLDGAEARGRMMQRDDVAQLSGRRVPSLAEARALADADRDDEAQAVLEAMVERDPADGHAWYGLARVHLKAERFEPAADALEQAAGCGFDPPGSYVGAARAWCAVGREELALACLEEAVAVGYDGIERLRRLPELERLSGNERFEALFAKKR